MNEDGRWVTLKNGIHIFIKDGQTIEEAIAENFDDENLPHKQEFDGGGWEEEKGLNKFTKIKPGKFQEAYKILNDNYQKYGAKNKGRENNCQKQVAAFELRMRGYDVLPNPYNPYYEEKEGKLARKQGNEDLGYSAFFNLKKEDLVDLYFHPNTKSEFVYFWNRNYEDVSIPTPIKAHLSKFPNSRWVISVKWAVTKNHPNLRHIFNAIVDDKGKVTFIDTQRQDKVSYANTWKRLSKSVADDARGGYTVLGRVDNKEINEDLLDVYIKGEDDND